MANVDDRLTVRPAGVREQDSRKRFQTDRVGSVRKQTMIPPPDLPAWLTWMTGLPDNPNATGREGVVVGGS
jgi:hypothetical protein